MALVVADRVKETTTTTGTGAITLAGAETNFVTFSSVLSNADTTYYAIVDNTNSAFEVGLGTYASSGNTITRTTIISSSNSNNAVDLQAGSKDVFVTLPSTSSHYLMHLAMWTLTAAPLMAPRLADLLPPQARLLQPTRQRSTPPTLKLPT